MALFKILKGNKSSLPSTKTEGYMYITKDTGDIYVDISSNSRIQLNADKAYRLKNNDDSLISVGKSNKPVYFENGIPKICENVLDLSINGNAATSTKATQDSSGNIIANTYVKKNGDVMTGTLSIQLAENPYLGLYDGTNNWYIQALQTENKFGMGPTWEKATKWDTEGNMSCYGEFTASKVWGAVWNDYAEFRETMEEIEPGRVVIENGDDTLSLSIERLQPGANIVSDTYGMAIGKTEYSQTPIAVSGRVLAYPLEDRDQFHPGDAVCSGPYGTVSLMTRDEIREYPERIIGTVSAIPEYETWGSCNIKVNGRIWIKVK